MHFNKFIVLGFWHEAECGVGAAGFEFELFGREVVAVDSGGFV